MPKKDWLEFQKKYRLDNSLYNFVIRPGVFESTVAIFFIIGIPSTFIIGERFATILSVVFSVLTYLVLNIIYSMYLKKIKYIDIFALSIFFNIRIFSGIEIDPNAIISKRFYCLLCLYFLAWGHLSV